MLVTITYIIACASFVGAIVFFIVFTIKKQKQRDLENSARWTMLFDYLAALDSHINYDKK